ncbi:MAG: hypothetical protein J5661_03250 [Bacteroidaceae bacterium]|nr:hypothetical protein [Bacteroidaceae bacterium]
MAKSRFGGLQDTMQTAQDVIQEAKNAPVETPEATQATIAEEPAQKGKKGRKPIPVTIERNSLRNVGLDDKTLWRLEHIKKRLNRQRQEGDPFVSIDSLIYRACVEWLDKNYPETAANYETALSMGLIV